jgi:hypothetical protein
MTGRPGIIISAGLYTAVLAELARRGDGHREAGAFLLADVHDVAREAVAPRIVAAAYYDDLDPHCLTGGITFTATGYTALNALCREQRLCVVADMHTHPRDWVGQSCLDAAHPMVALPGHVAIIVPGYAIGDISVEQIGVHVLGSDATWQSYFEADTADIVHVEAPVPTSRIRFFLRHLMGLARYRPWRRHR